MSSKKRFEQLEMDPRPEKPEKKSLIDHFRFKRKLELEGEKREEACPPRSVLREPEPPRKEISRETRVELETLAKDIEAAEEKKTKELAEQKIRTVRNKTREDALIKAQNARKRIQSARSRVFLSLAVLGVIGSMIYFLLHSRGSSLRFHLLNITFILMFAISAILRGGRNRRW